MIIISVTELRKHFFKYIKMLENGSEDVIFITRYKMISFKEKERTKRIGAGKEHLPSKPFSLKGDNKEIIESFYSFPDCKKR